MDEHERIRNEGEEQPKDCIVLDTLTDLDIILTDTDPAQSGNIIDTLNDLDIILTADAKSKLQRGYMIFRSLEDWTAPLFNASMNVNDESSKWSIALELHDFIVKDAGMRFVGCSGGDGKEQGQLFFRKISPFEATHKVMKRMELHVKGKNRTTRECSLNYVYRDGMRGWRRKMTQILLKQTKDQKYQGDSKSNLLPKSLPPAPVKNFIDATAELMDDENDGADDNHDEVYFATLVERADQVARGQASVEKVTDLDIILDDILTCRSDVGNRIFTFLIAATWRMYHEALCCDCKTAIVSALYHFVKYEAGMCFRVPSGSDQYYEATQSFAKQQIECAFDTMREGPLGKSVDYDKKPDTLKEWKIRLYDIVIKVLSASIHVEAKQRLLQRSAEAAEAECTEAVGAEHVHVTNLDILIHGKTSELKAINSWLSFHTGNVICQQLIEWTCRMYKEAPTNEVKNLIVSELHRYMIEDVGMRFLLPDKITDEICVIPSKAAKDRIRTALNEAKNSQAKSPGYDKGSILFKWKSGLNDCVKGRLSQVTRKCLYTRKYINSRILRTIIPEMNDCVKGRLPQASRKCLYTRNYIDLRIQSTRISKMSASVVEQDTSISNHVPLQFSEADGGGSTTGTNNSIHEVEKELQPPHDPKKPEVNDMETRVHELKRKHYCGERSGTTTTTVTTTTGGLINSRPRCASREETVVIIGALRNAVAAAQSDVADKSSSLSMVAEWLHCVEKRHKGR